MSSSFCASCKAPIEWGRFAKSGKPVPLDPGARADGNLVVEAVDVDGVPLLRVLNNAEMAEDRDFGPRFKSHFSSCPNAARHRH